MSTSEVYCASPSISQKHRKQSQKLSFPSRPELCIESPIVSDHADTFITDTKILVEACIQAALKGSLYNYGGLSSGLKDMVHCVIKMGRNNHDSFEEMCDQLELSTANIYVNVQKVFTSVFDDGIVNWGRTLALLAFGGHLADFCLRHRLGEVVDSIGPWITLYISNFMNMKRWVLEHGGWVNLVKRCNPQKSVQLQQLPQKQHADEKGSWLSFAMSGVQVGVHIFNVLNGK